jgi:hypothetical protein
MSRKDDASSQLLVQQALNSALIRQSNAIAGASS